MSSKLPYFMISAALPSIRFSFTILYSLVKGSVCIMRVLSLIVLICMELVLYFYKSPSRFLKCSYHFLTRSSFLMTLIFPLFGFLRPVTLLINFQLSVCLLCSLDCSIRLIMEFRISASMVSYYSCRSSLDLYSFSCESFVLERFS